MSCLQIVYVTALPWESGWLASDNIHYNVFAAGPASYLSTFTPPSCLHSHSTLLFFFSERNPLFRSFKQYEGSDLSLSLLATLLISGQTPVQVLSPGRNKPVPSYCLACHSLLCPTLLDSHSAVGTLVHPIQRGILNFSTAKSGQRPPSCQHAQYLFSSERSFNNCKEVMQEKKPMHFLLYI